MKNCHFTLVLAIFSVLALSGCFGRSSEAGRTQLTRLEIDNTAGKEAFDVPVRGGAVVCLKPGARITLEMADAVQPEPADEAATAAIDPKEGLRGSTGAAAEFSQALADMGWLQWVGIGLVLLGGIIVVARRGGLIARLSPGPTGVVASALSNLPKGSGWVIAGTGVGLILLPWFLEEYGWMIGLAAAVVLAVLLWRFIHNLGKDEQEQKRSPLRPGTPPEQPPVPVPPPHTSTPPEGVEHWRRPQ